MIAAHVRREAIDGFGSHSLLSPFSGWRPDYARRAGAAPRNLAAKARLIVEADGGYHARRVTADVRRDRKLERAGYRVLRVEAAQVTRDLATVIANIGDPGPRPALPQPALSHELVRV